MSTSEKFLTLHYALNRHKRKRVTDLTGLASLTRLLARYQELLAYLNEKWPMTFDNLNDQGMRELRLHLSLVYAACGEPEQQDCYSDFCNYLDAALLDAESIVNSQLEAIT